MDLSGFGDSSLVNGLAEVAAARAARSVKGDIQSAVAEQIKQSEKAQGEMITKLIESMPSPDPNVGKALDTSA